MEAEAVAPKSLSCSRWAVTSHYGINGLLLATWFSRFPDVANRLEIPTATLGIATFVMSISAMVATPPTKRLLLSPGSARTLRWMTPSLAVVLFLAASSPKLWVLIAMLGLLGVALGVQGTAMNAYGTSAGRLAGRTWMPSMIGAVSVGGIVGALGGTMASKLDAGLLPHVLLVCGLCLAVALCFPIPDLPPGPEPHTLGSHDRRVTHLLSTRTGSRGGHASLFFTIGLAAAISEGALASFAVVYFEDVLHATGGVASASLTVFSASIAVMRLNGGRISDRFGVLRTLLIGGLLTSLAGWLLVAAISVPVSFVALVLIGLGVACGIPLVFQVAAAHAFAAASGPEQDRVVAKTISNLSLACAGGYLSGGAVTGLLASLVGLRLALGLVMLGGLLIALASAAVLRAGVLGQSERPMSTGRDIKSRGLDGRVELAPAAEPSSGLTGVEPEFRIPPRTLGSEVGDYSVDWRRA